jgi:tRNA nucleotidyltransferase (CCA-adding enzyme)
VLEKIRPTAPELERTYGLASELIAAVNESGIAEGMMVGSVARRTCIRGDLDLDIFMLFPPTRSREDLEEKGIDLARQIAQRFSAPSREKYAEHPYLNATVRGIDVDLVPCFKVADASGIISAVDRTPFHTRYVSGRIDAMTDDVLLAKQFAKAGGVYGSDQMTEGFSGYLCEILVLEYGGFSGLMSAASRWKPGVTIDLEGHQARQFSDPLIVIDPVDPCRNVAASVSLTRMLEFSDLAAGYLEAPSEAFFFPPDPSSFSRDDLAEMLGRRGTTLYAVTFATPPFIEDIVVPQLRKSTDAIADLLARNGFIVNRVSHAMGRDRCILFFELLTDLLPPVRRHTGPPVSNRENTARFIEKYIDPSAPGLLAGPFIEGGVYIVELTRRHRRAGDLLMSDDVMKVGLGKHVRRAMEDTYEVLFGRDCWSPDFSREIGAFIHKESPLVKVKRLPKRENIAPDGTWPEK